MPMYAGVTVLLRARTFRFAVPRIRTAAQRPSRLSQQDCHLRLQHREFGSAADTRPAQEKPRKALDAARSEDNTTSYPNGTAALSVEVERTNHARNSEIRHAFRDWNDEISQTLEDVLDSAYIPPARQYPTAEATALSLQRARRIARIRVGHEILARKGGSARSRGGQDTFNLLKRMTQPRGEKSAMHAMRIVLPKSLGFDIDNSKSVGFVESTTGLGRNLRMTSDRDNATAVVLRGESAALAKAADELIKACRDVQIFKLGEVTTLDYAAKRLWPMIEGAEDGDSIVPSNKMENVWLHKEQEEYWVDSAYEKTPRPAEWTKASFDTFITALIYGRLKPELAMSIYRRRFFDTDGVRVRMIMDAFEDPETRAYITAPVLKIALQFISTRGGHRASAERLLAQAERWGVPLDTDVYNILLDSYVHTHDVRYFHKLLIKMRERCFYPNARTWLIFLGLVQRDDMRRQVESAMFDLGFFQDPGTRRSVSVMMAGFHAYEAFRAGQPLRVFLDKNIQRFGPEWLTVDTANATLREFFLFHQKSDTSRRYHDYRILVDRLCEDNGKLDISTVNIVLEHCAQPYVQDWESALWVLDRMIASGEGEAVIRKRGPLAPNRDSYYNIIKLCMSTHSSAALGATIFYAIKNRQLVGFARKSVSRTVIGKDEDVFWCERKPRMLSRAMADMLRSNPVSEKAHAVAGLEFAVLEGTKGYIPAVELVDVLRKALDLDRQHERAAAAAAATTPLATREGAEANVATVDGAVTISLLDVTKEQRAGIKVRLDATFDTRRMVRYNQTPKTAGPAEAVAEKPVRIKTAGQRKADGSNSGSAWQKGAKAHLYKRQGKTSNTISKNEGGSKEDIKEESTTVPYESKSDKNSPKDYDKLGKTKDGDHPLVKYLNSLP